MIRVHCRNTLTPRPILLVTLRCKLRSLFQVGGRGKQLHNANFHNFHWSLYALAEKTRFDPEAATGPVKNSGPCAVAGGTEMTAASLADSTGRPLSIMMLPLCTPLSESDSDPELE
jgi:hypothetical protein